MHAPLDSIPAPVARALLTTHLLVWTLLALYGLHRLHLLRVYRRRAALPSPEPLVAPAEWPRVTVQLPVFNEQYVVERLLQAAVDLEYPRDRLEIQLLDDSTDETTQIAAAKVRTLRDAGFDVVHHRRTSRAGFKAGALQEGLTLASGEFLAVFDADFVPPPNFLRDTVPHFSNPNVGMVQGRWRHLNQDYSALAQAQAISLDGHFVVEHAARMADGCFFNFNGTAGILRKSCIEDAGGWQSDTLTEDLDLSYRAQLKGWLFVFAPAVGCPSELPVEMNAFKSQQHRWVKGSVQVARKILPAIWRSSLPARVKWEATFHLTSNAAYVALLLLSAIVYPVVIARYASKSLLFSIVDAVLFLTATVSVTLYLATAQRATRPDWRRMLGYLPFVMSLGIGLAVNNTRAVLGALVGGRGVFHRTPKFSIERRGDGWRGKRYRAPGSLWALVELSFAIYFAWAMFALVEARLWAPLPFFLLYFFGFVYVGALSFVHAARRA